MDVDNKLIGFNDLFENLIELYKRNILPNKILLSGKKGIGKSIFVSHFLNFIFSQNEEFKYNLKNFEINEDNISHQHFKKNMHPNIFLIKKKNEKKFIDISQIREMMNFQNRSSLNDLFKFIIINNVSDLNLNSSNSLLKSIEEPNNNVFYILTHNVGSYIPETIKSRCIEFKMFLSSSNQKLILKNHFNESINEEISKDLINFYDNPSFTISLINYLNDNSLSYANTTIENLISLIIKKKDYIKNEFINENINSFIELFFYKNIGLTNNITYKLKNYFYIKLNQARKYNLDMESFFIEFQEMLLSE